jgi:hypothetical protein
MQTVTTIGLDIAKCRPENKAAPVLGVTGAASCDGSPDRCLGRKPRSSPDPTIEDYDQFAILGKGERLAGLQRKGSRRFLQTN